MLALLSVVVIAGVAWASLQEGLLVAIARCVNVMISGIVAILLFEPCADYLEPLLAGSILAGMEDAICLAGLFAASAALLRVMVDNLADQDIEMAALPQQVATGLASLVTGYLLSGFLVVVLSTLPLPEKLLGHDTTGGLDEPIGLTKVLPGDRVWLALMHRLSGNGPLGPGGETPAFDQEGTFPLRYAKKRRVAEEPGAGVTP
jgi:hypothetical protein